MFKGKPTRVIITGRAKEEFYELNKVVDEETKRGLVDSDHKILLTSVKRKIELLRNNPEYGIHIPRDRIPKEYVRKYGVNNLWKINLSGAWRMIYTIKGNDVEIISVILDLLNHKNYNKIFGYKKK